MNTPSPVRPPRRALSLAAILAVLASPTASAQTPDTTAAWRYLPLAVGNEWHSHESHTTGSSTVESDIRTVVRSEVAGTPGRYVVETTRIRSRPGGLPPVVTIAPSEWFYDPVSQRVVSQAFSGDAASPTPCPLGAPFDAAADCGGRFWGVTGGHMETVTVGTQSVTATRKQYDDSSTGGGSGGGYAVYYTFAAGIGRTFFGYNTYVPPPGASQTYRNLLQYARVGSREYGQALSFPSAEEAAPLQGTLALSVGPNPSSHTVTLRYTLAAPGTVRLALSDMLGREVAVLVESEGSAGANEVRLDVGRLAPGLYLVRLESGSQTLSQRLTVAR